ncbi:MAG: hypothetical protein IJT30_01355 [Muribaculaceae bacterium]|nr:hypothetical protein [Muribaculaceae bacterium]
MTRILYIHGFCSSAQTGTVSRLRQVFPDCEVHAIDVNHHPAESVALVERYVAQNGIGLLVGTSLGGYYVLCASVRCPKVAVNPATRPDVMLNQPSMMGHLRYFNPRQDGNWYFDFGPENLLEFRGREFHITPDTYIICSDHDELLGDNRAACRALVAPDHYFETSQIGHRMAPEFTQPGSGHLWQLLQKLK